MTLSATTALLVVATLAPAVPLAVGVARFRTLPLGGKLLLAWLSLSLGLNIAMMAMGARGVTNSVVAHLSLPVFCALGLVAFGELVGHRGYRRAVHGVAFFYLMAWGVLTIKDGIPVGFSTYPQSLMNLVLTVAATGLVVVRLRWVESHPLRDPAVLTGLAALVSFAPSVAIDPVAAVAVQSSPQLVATLYLLRAGLFVLGIFLYTLALLWIPPHRSSSGS